MIDTGVYCKLIFFLLKQNLNLRKRIYEEEYVPNLRCNVCMVWSVVYTVGAEGNKRCRQLRDQVIQDSAYNPESLFKLLLNTSQYEFNLKEVSIFSYVTCILVLKTLQFVCITVYTLECCTGQVIPSRARPFPQATLPRPSRSRQYGSRYRPAPVHLCPDPVPVP